MIEASIFRESNVGHRLRSNASHICGAVSSHANLRAADAASLANFVTNNAEVA